MNNIIRCKKCSGQKKIMGMGMIKHDCDACSGIGYIKNEPQEVIPLFKSSENQPKRKRGRPVGTISQI